MCLCYVTVNFVLAFPGVGLPLQLTLYHQSQTKNCWLKRVPLGQMKALARPSGWQMWNTCVTRDRVQSSRVISAKTIRLIGFPGSWLELGRHNFLRDPWLGTLCCLCFWVFRVSFLNFYLFFRAREGGKQFSLKDTLFRANMCSNCTIKVFLNNFVSRVFDETWITGICNCPESVRSTDYNAKVWKKLHSFSYLKHILHQNVIVSPLLL